MMQHKNLDFGSRWSLRLLNEFLINRISQLKINDLVMAYIRNRFSISLLRQEFNVVQITLARTTTCDLAESRSLMLLKYFT